MADSGGDKKEPRSGERLRDLLSEELVLRRATPLAAESGWDELLSLPPRPRATTRTRTPLPDPASPPAAAGAADAPPTAPPPAVVEGFGPPPQALAAEEPLPIALAEDDLFPVEVQRTDLPSPPAALPRPSSPPPRPGSPPPEQLLAEWDDQPTSLFQARTRTPGLFPGFPEPRRTTTANALVLRTTSAGPEAFAELLGGPLNPGRALELAAFPRTALLPSLFTPDSLVANRYRLLGHRIEEAANQEFCRTLAVVSPSAGDGKTLTALNLALILAEDPSRKVALVDCNLRRPSLAAMLGLPSGGGLLGLYRRELTLSQALIQLGERHLFLLPAGDIATNPAEVLRSPLLTAVVRRLEMELGLVILDTSAVLPSADVNLLARLVDRFVVVVRAGRTRRDRLAEALQQLEEAKILGLVFNEDEG